MSLLEIIKNMIKQDPDHSISYYDYMELALYEPAIGYYSKEKVKVGKEGDFYTSSSVGDVFGETLGDIFADMMSRLSFNSPGCLVEFGGGNGELMAQILRKWVKSNPDLLRVVRPVMIEKSEFHRRLQKEKLADFPVQWFEEWSELVSAKDSINGVVYSNELLDAFPVKIAEWRNGEWKEVRVGWNEEKAELEERLVQVKDIDLLHYLKQEEPYIPKSLGYRVEFNQDAGSWIREIGRNMVSGYLITIDYGYLRPELYLPQRKRGTVMSYRQHIASEDVLDLPGEKDITSHVNFSYMIEEGEKHGLSHLGFFTQSQFLINGGILSKLQSHQESDPFHGAMSKRNRAIRQLILPGGMGDAFKVLVHGKGVARREVLGLEPKGWV
ncbi:SAM-dependent methyltransferase [Ammoniphilus sp. 3BR4]